MSLLHIYALKACLLKLKLCLFPANISVVFMRDVWKSNCHIQFFPEFTYKISWIKTMIVIYHFAWPFFTLAITLTDPLKTSTCKQQGSVLVDLKCSSHCSTFCLISRVAFIFILISHNNIIDVSVIPGDRRVGDFFHQGHKKWEICQNTKGKGIMCSLLVKALSLVCVNSRNGS